MFISSSPALLAQQLSFAVVREEQLFSHSRNYQAVSLPCSSAGVSAGSFPVTELGARVAAEGLRALSTGRGNGELGRVRRPGWGAEVGDPSGRGVQLQLPRGRRPRVMTRAADGPLSWQF